MSNLIAIQPNTDLLPIHTLENVKENSTSKREKKKEQIIQYIIADLKSNPMLSKTDVASIARTCQLIENTVKKKDKIDKLKLTTAIFEKLFVGIQSDEITFIKNTVQVVLDGVKIKKLSTRAQLYSYARKIVISNFLFRE